MTQILSDVPLAYSEQKSQKFIFLALKCSWRHGTHNMFQSSFFPTVMEESLCQLQARVDEDT